MIVSLNGYYKVDLSENESQSKTDFFNHFRLA